jgi:hypothetical protein
LNTCASARVMPACSRREDITSSTRPLGTAHCSRRKCGETHAMLQGMLTWHEEGGLRPRGAQALVRPGDKVIERARAVRARQQPAQARAGHVAHAARPPQVPPAQLQQRAHQRRVAAAAACCMSFASGRCI